MEKVQRPKAEKRKIHSKEDFELCYLRHRYLRKVKFNPTKEQMAPYHKIVKYTAGRTFSTYHSLFETIGMSYQDVLNIGKVHIVSFLGLFVMSPNKNVKKYRQFVSTFKKQNNNEKPHEEDLLNKNKANFTLFMKQRMEDLVRICRQKAKNIKGLRVDEYIPFCGKERPPTTLEELLENSEDYGFRHVDLSTFKAIKKRQKANIGEPFQFAGLWYVAVPVHRRALSLLDLEGAGLDPRDASHNQNPEQILLKQQEEKRLDKRRRVYKNSSRKEKIELLTGFIRKNLENPKFYKEVIIAQRFLRKMGVENVG